ncbi:hypothetical protein VTK73DRAFT_8830 [Phialemonium thermophilum]|uniref:Uncharacterized protein n=1 Tax=Phialemonium thermophilum TaxID=223376 RepID=A0ABR3W632_9PEZI
MTEKVAAPTSFDSIADPGGHLARGRSTRLDRSLAIDRLADLPFAWLSASGHTKPAESPHTLLAPEMLGPGGSIRPLATLHICLALLGLADTSAVPRPQRCLAQPQRVGRHVSDLRHLGLEQPDHPLPHLGQGRRGVAARGLVVAPEVEELHRVVVAVEQLPLLVLAAAVGAGDVVAHIVPEDELPALVADAVVCLERGWLAIR